MHKTLYQTSDAGLSIRQQMQDPLYQAADAGHYQTGDAGDAGVSYRTVYAGVSLSNS